MSDYDKKYREEMKIYVIFSKPRDKLDENIYSLSGEKKQYGDLIR